MPPLSTVPSNSTVSSKSTVSPNSTVPSNSTEPSIGTLAANASTHLSTIIRGEVELAKTELKVSVKNGGVGAALFVAAAIILTFALTFGFVALAELIHFFGLWRWASYLCVFGLLALVAAALAFVGLRKVKKVKAPQRTIDTTKDTVSYLKHPTSA